MTLALFLSTPSARRATTSPAAITPARANFYPRPPRGGRRYALSKPEVLKTISIHALREEGDRCNNFRKVVASLISIHALREEGDADAAIKSLGFQDFYPRPPRGGRRRIHPCGPAMCRFLSTPSARRATIPAPSSSMREKDFYPRPPRGGRRYPIEIVEDATLFLSTPSARRATGGVVCVLIAIEFLSTPSARRATRPAAKRRWICTNFYPRPPRGGRPSVLGTIVGWVSFLSTPSARRATRRGMRRGSPDLHFYPRPPRGGRPRRASHDDIPRAISIHALREEGDT